MRKTPLRVEDLPREAEAPSPEQVGPARGGAVNAFMTFFDKADGEPSQTKPIGALSQTP